jgi:predicted transcriptional regulator of viral defense system
MGAEMQVSDCREVAAMSSVPPTAEALHRLMAVFTEVPGAHLTLDDAAKLSGIDPDRCAMFLETLEDTGVLQRLQDGRYALKNASST